MIKIRHAVLAALFFAAVLTAGKNLADEPKKEDAKPEAAMKALEYSAVILPPAGSDNITPSEIYIKIDRFTTPEERQTLRTALDKETQSQVLTRAQNMVKKNPIGRIIRDGSGIDILFAAKDKTDKGEQVVLVAQRGPIYKNTIMNADNVDLPFSVLWFATVDGGKGEGKIIGTAALKMDPNGQVQIEGYKPSAANLANIRAR
jgi:hypothetical protein